MINSIDIYGKYSSISMSAVASDDRYSPENLLKDKEPENKRKEDVSLEISNEGRRAAESGGKVRYADEDGRVINKEVSQQMDKEHLLESHRERDDRAEEKVEKYVEHSENLVGKSKSQVEQMYRQGKVSYSEYEKNMEERKERAKELSKADEEDGRVVEKEKTTNNKLSDADKAEKEKKNNEKKNNEEYFEKVGSENEKIMKQIVGGELYQMQNRAELEADAAGRSEKVKSISNKKDKTKENTMKVAIA